MNFHNGSAGRIVLWVFRGIWDIYLLALVGVNTYFRAVDAIRYFTSRHLNQPEA